MTKKFVFTVAATLALSCSLFAFPPTANPNSPDAPMLHSVSNAKLAFPPTANPNSPDAPMLHSVVR